MNAVNTLEHSRHFIEPHRSNSEMLRIDPSRKTPLSPCEALAFQTFMRSHEADGDNRLSDYRVGRYQQGVRAEVSPNRNELQRTYERRTPGTEESDRLLNLQQSSPGMHRSPLSPPHSSIPPSHHSTNLVLGRADGAIIGPLSMYDYYALEHKR